MCTVIITVPEDELRPVRLLAVRDEDPARPWNRLGRWWPDQYPGVIGIRDERAGGAWLAADPATSRLAVLLNRHDLSDRSDAEVHTRGTVALESVVGRSPDERPHTRGFNLLEVTAHTARVVSWNGLESRTLELSPGTHMVAHDDVDDPGTARISTWLPEFRTAAENAPDEDWWRPWLAIMDRSAQLAGDEDAAIIRRQTYEGVPSYSLLLCVGTVSESGVEVRDAPLTTPGEWAPAEFG